MVVGGTVNIINNCQFHFNFFFASFFFIMHIANLYLYAWGYSQTKSGGDVRPASQNPYLICDQNLRYFRSYPIYDLTINSKPYL